MSVFLRPGGERPDDVRVKASSELIEPTSPRQIVVPGVIEKVLDAQTVIVDCKEPEPNTVRAEVVGSGTVKVGDTVMVFGHVKGASEYWWVSPAGGEVPPWEPVWPDYTSAAPRWRYQPLSFAGTAPGGNTIIYRPCKFTSALGFEAWDTATGTVVAQQVSTALPSYDYSTRAWKYGEGWVMGVFTGGKMVAYMYDPANPWTTYQTATAPGLNITVGSDGALYSYNGQLQVWKANTGTSITNVTGWTQVVNVTVPSATSPLADGVSFGTGLYGAFFRVSATAGKGYAYSFLPGVDNATTFTRGVSLRTDNTYPSPDYWGDNAVVGTPQWRSAMVQLANSGGMLSVVVKGEQEIKTIPVAAMTSLYSTSLTIQYALVRASKNGNALVAAYVPGPGGAVIRYWMVNLASGAVQMIRDSGQIFSNAQYLSGRTSAVLVASCEWITDFSESTDMIYVPNGEVMFDNADINLNPYANPWSKAWNLQLLYV